MQHGNSRPFLVLVPCIPRRRIESAEESDISGKPADSVWRQIELERTMVRFPTLEVFTLKLLLPPSLPFLSFLPLSLCSSRLSFILNYIRFVIVCYSLEIALSFIIFSYHCRSPIFPYSPFSYDDLAFFALCRHHYFKGNTELWFNSRDGLPPQGWFDDPGNRLLYMVPSTA